VVAPGGGWAKRYDGKELSLGQVLSTTANRELLLWEIGLKLAESIV
jgi:hypothetical protein